MIIGKDSIWKMAALFALILLAALDIIFCSRRITYVLNAVLVAGTLAGIAVKLYRKWSAEK